MRRSVPGARGGGRRAASIRGGALCVMLGALAGCSQLDPRIRYLCEDDGSCFQAGHVCQKDGYCRPADGGDPSACVPARSCPVAVECGRVDAGCGVELLCGGCTPPLECGAREPYRCALPSLCGRDGWCFERPLPQGSTIRAGWAADERNVWWVGDDATVLRWDGERHRLLSIPSSVPEGTSFWGVHGTSARDVYVVGSLGTILHFDGEDWLIETVDGDVRSELLAVFARAVNDVVAVGADGTVLRRQLVGKRWVALQTASLSERIVAVGVGAAGLFRAISASGAVQSEPTPGGAPWVAAGSLGLAPRALWRSPEGLLYAVGLGVRSLDGGAPASGSWLVREAIDGGAWHTVAALPFEGVALAGATGAELYVAGADGALAAVVDGRLRLAEDGGSPAPLWAPGGLNAVVVLDGGLWAQGERGLVVTAPRGAPLSALEVRSTGLPAVLSGLCGESPDTLTAVALAPDGCGPGACEAQVMIRTESDRGPKWEAFSRPVDSAQRTAFSACLVRGGDRLAFGDDSRVHVSLGGGPFAATGIVDPAEAPQAHRAGFWFQATERYLFPARSPVGSFSAITSVNASLGAPRTDWISTGSARVRAIAGTTSRAFVAGTRGLLRELLPDGGSEVLPGVSLTQNLTSLGAVTLADGGVQLTVGGDDGSIGQLLLGQTVEVRSTLFAGHVWNAVWAGGDDAAWVGGYEWVTAAPVDGGSRVRVARSTGDGGFEGIPVERAGRVSGLWADGSADGGVWLATDRGAILRRAAP